MAMQSHVFSRGGGRLHRSDLILAHVLRTISSPLDNGVAPAGLKFDTWPAHALEAQARS
jgi:hypothetical protein